MLYINYMSMKNMSKIKWNKVIAVNVNCCFLDAQCILQVNSENKYMMPLGVPCSECGRIQRWICQGHCLQVQPVADVRCEMWDLPITLYVWMFFSDLEVTLAHYSVHPHLSFYFFPVAAALGKSPISRPRAQHVVCLTGTAPLRPS